jgi:hypothetical protein
MGAMRSSDADQRPYAPVAASLATDSWAANQIQQVGPNVEQYLQRADERDLTGWHWPLHRARTIAYAQFGRQPPPPPLIHAAEGPRHITRGD